MLSHSSGSPFLASDGTLVAELRETDDTVLIEPVGADIVRITINNDAHEYVRSSVLGVSVSGGDGNDRLEVSAALDIDAALSGGAGSDTLIGGAAADVLDGGPDADSLAGDDGDDVFVVDPSDTVDGGPGIDSLTLFINGTDEPDSIRIENVNDTTTRVTINGSSYDYVRYEFTTVEIAAGAGNDLVELTADVQVNAQISGDSGDDTLIGGAGNDVVDGGAGADSLVAGAGYDSIVAEHTEGIDSGTGNDSLTLLVAGTDSSDSIQIQNLDTATVRLTINGSPFDSPRSELRTVQIQAGAGNDLVEVAADVEFVAAIYGSEGADTLAAGQNADTIDGGPGNDSLTGGDGGDLLSGSDGFDTIDGGAGDDSIDGGSLDDSLLGSDGADTIWGDTGADTVVGGDGDDSLSGGLGEGYPTDLVDGADSVLGGLGNDTVYGAAGADSLDGEAGDDFLSGGIDGDSLIGGDGADQLIGGSEADTLLGGAGDDRLDGGLGVDSIDGGLDFNTLSVFGSEDADTITAVPGANGNMTVTVGSESDTVTAVEYVEVWGLDGNDSITIDELLDVDVSLDGGDGDDTLVGGHGSDILFGAAGNDSVNGRDGFDTVRFVGTDEDDAIALSVDAFGSVQIQLVDETDAAGGVETVFVNAADGNDSIVASFDSGALGPELNFWLEGRDGDDTLTGGPWADFLYGGGGFDSLEGAAGDDILFGASGDDTLIGGDGSDFIVGTTGDDSVVAGLGDDTVLGGDGYDTILAEDGDDLIDGGDFDDSIFGGPGDDTLGGWDGADTVYGDAGNDSIDGGNSDDWIDAGDGWDTISGGAGDDSIGAGDGNDSIVAQSGDDSVGAGPGDDTAVGGDGDDTMDGQGGADSMYGGLGNDLIIGGEGNDTLGSDQGDDVFYGGAGDDQISGGADDDSLDGGAGNDVLDGGAGDDRLLGGSRSTARGRRNACDNDTLIGAGEDDQLDGGGGRDRLDGGAGTNDLTTDPDRDTVVAGPGTDRIQQIRKSDRTCSRAVRRGDSKRSDNLRRSLLEFMRLIHRPNGDDRRHTLLGNSRDPGSDVAGPPPGVIASFHDVLQLDRANLALATTTDVTPVPSAQLLIYTHTITNAGPRRATYVTLYDTFAENATVISLAATQANGEAGTCTLSATNDMVCDLGRLRDNGSESATVTAQVVVDAPPGNLANTAIVLSFNRDPNLGNNSTSNNNPVTPMLASVYVTAPDSVAGEVGGNLGQFRICRYNDVSATPLAVGFDLGGTATEVNDYLWIDKTATIAANQSCAPVITVTPADDPVYEGPAPETVVLTLQNGEGYTYSTPPTATVEISDDEQPHPTVTISVVLNAAEAGLVRGMFRVDRGASAPVALTVNYTVQTNILNAATPDRDYNPLQVSVTIPPNAAFAEIFVTPKDDPFYEVDEYVAVTLDPSATYDFGSPSSATVTVTSDDAVPDIVTITAPDPDAAEPGPDTGTFTVSRNNPGSALTVTFNVTGTATSGADYQSIGTSVTIPANSLSKDITVQPVDDLIAEGDETVVVTLIDGANYDLGTPSTAAVTIHDNECSSVRVTKITRTGDRDLLQGATVTYTASLGRADPENVNGYFTWQYRELVFVGQRRHYGTWEAAVGTRSTNTFTVAETVAREGQYRVTLNSCGQLSVALLTVTVQAPCQILKVEWVGYDPGDGSTNLTDDNPASKGGGWRIFPDRNRPSNQAGSRVHNNVTVRVTLASGVRDRTVYIQNFDVDDPTDHNGPIDDDGIANPGPDNHGGSGTLNQKSKRTSNGVAEFRFAVTWNPGDNFRIVAACESSQLVGLRARQPSDVGAVEDSNGNLISDDPAVADVRKSSPLLSVWRRLHVEVDSMAQPFGALPADDLLVDDVPDPDTNGLAQAFDPIYIAVDVGTPHDNGATPYRHHFAGGEDVIDYTTGSSGQRGSKPEWFDYWQTYVIGIYEIFPGDDNDHPDDSDFGLTGWTSFDEPEASVIAMETIRDVAAQHGWTAAQTTHVQQAVVIHEIGHQFGLIHDAAPPQPRSVMWAPNGDAQEPMWTSRPLRFSDEDIKKVRKDFGVNDEP